MNFGEALEHLKHGGLLNSAGTRGTGFVTRRAWRVPAYLTLECYPRTQEFHARPYFIQSLGGHLEHWTPTNVDLLAEDWEIVEPVEVDIDGNRIAH